MNVLKYSRPPWYYESVETPHDRSAHGVVKDDMDRVLFDTLNSDVAEIHNEFDEDGVTRWCEASRQILTLAAAAPEMYDELARILKWLDTEVELVQGTGTGSTTGEIIDQAVLVKSLLVKVNGAS